MQDALFADPYEEATLTVAELNEGIGAAVRRAFPEVVWVRGEISDISRPPSGHVYFDLKGDGASIPVTLWSGDKAVVNAVLKRAGGAVRMTDGTEVRLRAQVSWWAERARVSLRMLSIDTAFTLGRLAEAREVLVQRLTAEGVLARQQALRMPAVPLRVGLVTSVGSAAEADFLQTLEASGFAFSVVAADARVQGLEAEASIVAALAALGRRPEALDVVCVVRGGGARTDLAAFDLEGVVRAVAGCTVPVLTGIGHETDSSVADLAAHRSHKTPTACAGALVEAVAWFRGGLDESARRLGSATSGGLERSTSRLHRAGARAAAGARQHLRHDEALLGVRRARLAAVPGRALELRSSALVAAEARVRALDPARTLARGWSITRTADGRVLRHAADAPAGAVLTTTVADGEVTSTVTERDDG